MSNPASKCEFCGNVGNLTKGHVWPKWFNQILPQTATHHEQETGKFRTFDSKVPGPVYETRIRPGHARSRKPRNTCLRCNSGWMSGIEGLAKRFTIPLISGQLFALPPFGQFSVASLFCLIATRLEFLGDMRAILLQDHDWLRYYREPSANWKIWITHFDGDDRDEHWSRTYGAQIDSSPPDKLGARYCNVRVSTLVIGQVCAHIFYSHDTDLVSKIGYEGISLSQIWPPSYFDLHTISLPTLDGKAVLWLHEAFARESKPMPA